MFYIDTWVRKRRIDAALMHAGPVIIIFVAFIGLTIWAALDAQHNLNLTKQATLNRNVHESQSAIQTRLATYQNILHASVAFFDSSTYISRESWAQYISDFEIFKRYPGVQGMAYAKTVSAAELPAFLDDVRAQGVPDFTVNPPGDRPSYTLVTYIEPLNNDNRQLLGYDISSNQTRQKALDLARDTSEVSITDTVKSLQPDAKNAERHIGFVMYVPIYTHNASLSNQAERQAAITGYIYAGFRSFDLFSHVFEKDTTNYGFLVYDNDTGSAGDPLYKSGSYDAINQEPGKQRVESTFSVYNQKWHMIAVASPTIISANDRSRPMVLLWGGVLLSTFVALFIYLLLVNRTLALTRKEQLEVQIAKDELLALASHQLRTPATGVKQYIGLLRDGYAGKLTKEQKRYIDKAYASNERQLSTINEMLFVAQADSNRMNLNRSATNISQMVIDILEEYDEVINQNEQQLSLDMPSTKVIIDADAQYIRMAIENIISNAVKYTPLGGDIHIVLKQRVQTIVFAVSDTGVGVAKKDFPLLFQKFSRIPNELTNKVSGSGIGLYLVQKIVTAHHGKVRFESQDGVGSTCTITLPRKA